MPALHHQHFCHCGSADLPSQQSARTPKPAMLRTSGSSLPIREARYHRRRLTCVAAVVGDGVSQQGRSSVVAAAGKVLEARASASSNGNGSQHLQEQEPEQPISSQPKRAQRSFQRLGSGTQAVHGGETGSRVRQGVADSLTTPIVQTSTYTFNNTAELIAYQEGRFGSFEYGRYGNPTTRAAEEKIMALEGAEDCLLSSSGMCSSTTMLLALVPAGGHIVTTTDCYRRTRQFIQTFLPKMGIGCTVIDPSDLTGLAAALEQHEVSLFFSESPTNPYLRCVDIPAIAKLCAATNTIVAVDSTFATPCNQRALELGADLVVHSATKYLAGHNDVLAGAVAGKSELVAKVRAIHAILGGVIDPHASYLLLRGMKTLELRVQRQNATALEIARRLEAHPRIARVHYPGLESHPDYAIAQQQMTGFGGVVSFEVDGDLWAAAAVIDGVRLPYIAPSLGGVESLIEQPTVVSYWDQGPEQRAKIGIKDSLIRFSCGVECMEDIWADLEQALNQI